MAGTLSDTDRYALETATSDRDLYCRLSRSEWLRDVEYQMPPWLADKATSPVIGMPIVVPHARRAQLDDSTVTPRTSNEIRLVRNKAAIKQILDEITGKAEAEVRVRDASQAAQLRSTVLAPFYQRIEEDHNTIVQLRQELSNAHAALQDLHSIEGQQEQRLTPSTAEVQALVSPSEEQPLKSYSTLPPTLTTDAAEQKALHADVTQNDLPSIGLAATQPFIDNGVGERALVPHIEKHASAANAAPNSDSRTPKRKATAPPDHHDQEFRHPKAGRIFDQHLAGLAIRIFEQVRKPLPRDPIEACGTAPLSILLQRPQDALNLAHKELHTTTPDGVDPCWRRLYEDATLYLVAQLLHKQSTQAQTLVNRPKRVKFTDDVDSGAWLREIVGKLDQAIIVAGAPGRRQLIDSIFDNLDPIAQRTLQDQDPQPLVRGLPPRHLETQFAITRPKVVMTQSAFRRYVDRVGNAVRPLVLRGVMSEWPGMELWQDLLYLKRHTMAGYRLVPVEVGKSYTDPGWGQEIITFSEFADRFLVPDEPRVTGYLAQYDIFHQIPTLRNDIHIPDYCYSAPPPPTGAAARTKGLDTVQALDEPLLNAWLGPKGTKSPLHTDPYHNILCQVVGYKYVRLYAPEGTGSLYPMGVDENGIEMGNTSEVDISVIRPTGRVSPELAAMRADMQRRFPLLKNAKYEEAVLGPGESLYIPLGWWHYVESLTTSISVSFWWN